MEKYEIVELPSRVVVIARIKIPSSPITATGVAICSPQDRFSFERGKEIAKGRALAVLDGRAGERKIARDKRLAAKRERARLRATRAAVKA